MKSNDVFRKCRFFCTSDIVLYHWKRDKLKWFGFVFISLILASHRKLSIHRLHTDTPCGNSLQRLGESFRFIIDTMGNSEPCMMPDTHITPIVQNTKHALIWFHSECSSVCHSVTKRKYWLHPASSLCKIHRRLTSYVRCMDFSGNVNCYVFGEPIQRRSIRRTWMGEIETEILSAE